MATKTEKLTPVPQKKAEPVPESRRIDASLDPREWALIRLIRQAGEGTIETLDYASGTSRSARCGFQTIRFDNPEHVERILLGDAVAVDMS